ncbi:MAG: hypothetical protein ACQEUB_04675 [Thermodesulfobacteriota bacterium]
MITWFPLATMLFIAAMAIIVLRYGRPAPQNRGRAVSAAQVENALTLTDLLEQAQDFEIYYSGEPVIPSALLFIPRNHALTWKLKSGAKGWKHIEDHSEVLDLHHRILREDASGSYMLQVLLPPPSLDHLQPEHAYLYSPQALTPQRIPNSHTTVSIHPVPEYNSSLYGAR